MQSYETREIAVRFNKGAPRIWLESLRLETAGFVPGTRYSLTVGDQRVVLTVKRDGARVVSQHKKGERRAIPVIDLNSAHSIGCFEGLDRVRVIILPGEIHLLLLATQKKAYERLERLERKLAAGEPLRVASVCHGGGVLSHALADGLLQSGVPTRLVMANDIDHDVLVQASTHNSKWDADTKFVAAPLQEIVADDYLMDRIGHVEILEAGLPCVGASLAGRAKKHLAMAEADPNAGHLIVAFIALIAKLQPALILLENVVPYSLTASMHLLRYSLRDLGYSFHETVLDAPEFGCIEARKRLCVVGTTTGVQFDFASLEKAPDSTRCLGDVLEPIPADSDLWQAYSYLRDKEVADKAAGKGFRMQILGPEAPIVGVIGASYAKCRSTEVKLAHPDPNDPRMRQLTPIEHARCKGVDPRLIEGMPATRAHHLLGNGVCPPPFIAVGKALGIALRAHTPKPSKKEAPAFALAAA